MSREVSPKPDGFTLLELVLVIVIIGVIAAIAIPRMSRGAAGAADGTLKGDLAVLRKAIDFYATEHGGDLPTAAKIEEQFLQYSDGQGNTQAAQDTTHFYGPYLRALPALPVGSRKGNTHIAKNNGTGVGWIYDENTGEIHANTKGGEKDEADVKYSDY